MKMNNQNNNLKVFEGHNVEIFKWEGKVLFNPRNVGECLGINDVTVRRHLQNFNEKQVIKLTNSDVHDMNIRKLNNAGENFLTESGVYKLIFKSHKEEAEKFQDWVTDEILPQLRRTGVVILDHAEEEAIDYEKKFGTYRIRKTFNNSNDLKADYEQFKELSIKEQKAKRINAAEKIKRTNIIFDTIQKRLNNNLATLKGSEMLAMQELLTDIKSDVLVLSNRKNGQEKRNIKKIASKYFDECDNYINYIEPPLEEYICIPYSPFSVNCVEDYKNKYYEWKRLFPRYFIKIDKTIDFNKPVDLWIQFDHMKKFDVTNLSKTFIDMITRVYSDYWKMPIDDNKIQLRNCSTHDYVDSYKESAIFYVLKQKIN